MKTGVIQLLAILLIGCDSPSPPRRLTEWQKWDVERQEHFHAYASARNKWFWDMGCPPNLHESGMGNERTMERLRAKLTRDYLKAQPTASVKEAKENAQRIIDESDYPKWKEFAKPEPHVKMLKVKQG